MHVHIRSRKFEVTDELNDFIADRFTRALDRFEGRVRDISVIIADVNGPKGGRDKLLRVRGLVSGCESVVITDFGSNLSLMIDNAAGRMKERVSSAIARGRHFKSRQRIWKEEVR